MDFSGMFAKIISLLGGPLVIALLGGGLVWWCLLVMLVCLFFFLLPSFLTGPIHPSKSYSPNFTSHLRQINLGKDDG